MCRHSSLPPVNTPSVLFKLDVIQTNEAKSQLLIYEQNEQNFFLLLVQSTSPEVLLKKQFFVLSCFSYFFLHPGQSAQKVETGN